MPENRPTELRRQKCGLRSALSREERALENDVIFRKVVKLAQYQKAESILIYASYQSEADTFGLISRALCDNKKVFCPKVEEKALAFYRIKDLTELKEGFRNIPEPEGNTEKFQINGIDSPKLLIIAPGTVFDRWGHRIGYGGGFYDRFLGQYEKENRPFCVGICYACQLTEKIEPMDHDISMDLVIHS
ncbi:MAG: 5-formyltetrahydrofolate cyclo-ligase [Lachnospiraceae bacterium]|nr:5-formyltetrahydrofolate cyclo-ligase [Lachnospiraceae bacterium]